MTTVEASVVTTPTRISVPKATDTCAIIALTIGACSIAAPYPLAMFAFAFAGLGTYRGLKHKVRNDVLFSILGAVHATIAVLLPVLT